MKKILGIALSLIMVVMLLTACGKKEEKVKEQSGEQGNTEIKTNINTNKTETNTNKEKQEESKQDGKLEGVHSRRFPGGEHIYVNYPTDCFGYEMGHTDFFYYKNDAGDTEKYVAITVVTEKGDWNLKTAHECALKHFKLNARNMSQVYSLDIISEKIINVNGIEVYCYEADLGRGLHEAEQHCYLIGYSFIFQGVPCNITGLAMQQPSQSEEQKEEVRTLVDEMMKTVRATKELK